MPTSLYDLIIPTFIKGLQTFDHVLTKAEQYAKEKGLNADEVFPQARLVDDQLPLVFQVQTATKAVQTTIGRLTGVEPTFFEDNEKTIADLHARIQKALEAVKSVKPEDVNSREDVQVELHWLVHLAGTGRADWKGRLSRKLSCATPFYTSSAFRRRYEANTIFMAILGLAVPTLTLDYHKTSTNSTLERAIVAIGESTPMCYVSAPTPGTQNISYEVDYPLLRQRIDRHIQPSHSWGWASPQLEPMAFSLVVWTGDGNSACFVKGNNEVFLPRNITSGCVDAALANKFATDALMMSPGLIKRVRRSKSSEDREVDINGIKLPAVYSNLDKLLLIVDPETSLPYIVRSEEQLPLYGNATKDLYLSNYKEGQGIKFPHTIQTTYSSSSQRLSVVLEYFVIDKSALQQSSATTSSILFLMAGNMSLLGSPVKNVSVDALKSSRPVDLLQVYWLIIDDSHDLGLKQLIIEFETEVIVCDAPPFWSEAVMEWIKRNIGKKVTYVAPSHHHRDHSGGVADYVRAGTKLIIPEMAVDYWSSIPGAEFITFNQTHPYVHRDNKV
ncbi:hypothetical protein FGLOB1_10835 [Fusarium globosum]|uniref:Metallo-beta-lactamase domain-containing protein n=1 Tax=Fusarium globosum TaxID=78864 RepID=A0A8H5XVP3_9HYPO|nr:hypothetical protein FGLOB1_10835 [Fusarium globosum]